MAVKVLAHGRDGFTGEDSAGRRHAVGWDSMLGHKSKVAMEMKVLDQGQEGAIVQDRKGRKRFLAGDIGAGNDTAAPETGKKPRAPRDPLMEGLDQLGKSLSAGGRVIFVKAAVANRPGLALKPVTDRSGHQTKRWVRTMKDMAAAPREAKQEEKPTIHDPRQTDIEDFTGGPPSMAHGDHVSFRHGEVRGHGWIVSSGRDGVTVKDGAGQVHQVRHDALEGKAGGGEGGTPNTMTDEKLDYPDHRPGSIGAKEPTGFSAAAHFKEHDAPDQATVEGVLSAFPPDTSEKMARIVDRLRGVTETKTAHMKDGAYTPERQALHADILGKFLSQDAVRNATPSEGENPTFTILGGRGGSGKSWFNGKVFDPKKAIVLDADEIKHMLPEYEGWNAFQVHEESGDLFDAITEKAKALGLNIVHDATMKTPGKAVALVKGFKEAGYKVAAHYMHLPRAEAAKRAVKRFLGPTGRFVPPEVILGNTQNEAAFDQVKDLADTWSFRDNQNRDGNGPTLIAESQHGQDPNGGASQDSGSDAGKDGRDGRAPPDRKDGDQGPGLARKDAGGPLRKGGAWFGRALFFLTGGRVVAR